MGASLQVPEYLCRAAVSDQHHHEPRVWSGPRAPVLRASLPQRGCMYPTMHLGCGFFLWWMCPTMHLGCGFFSLMYVSHNALGAQVSHWWMLSLVFIPRLVCYLQSNILLWWLRIDSCITQSCHIYLAYHSLSFVLLVECVVCYVGCFTWGCTMQCSSSSKAPLNEGCSLC